MAQAPSSGNSFKGSSFSGGKGSSKGADKSLKSAGKEIENLAGKVPAAKADRNEAGKIDIKGKWANFPGGLKAFQGK